MNDDYREDTHSIQVSFSEPVNISQDQTRRLVAILDEICAAWEAKHPDSVMWPAGIGGLITSMPITAEDEAAGVPMTVDMTILSIECFARERSVGEHLWMSYDEAKRWFPRAERPPIFCKVCGAPSSTKRECTTVQVAPRA